MEEPPAVAHPSMDDGIRPVVIPQQPREPGQLIKMRLAGTSRPYLSAKCGSCVWIMTLRHTPPPGQKLSAEGQPLFLTVHWEQGNDGRQLFPSTRPVQLTEVQRNDNQADRRVPPDSGSPGNALCWLTASFPTRVASPGVDDMRGEAPGLGRRQHGSPRSFQGENEGLAQRTIHHKMVLGSAQDPIVEGFAGAHLAGYRFRVGIAADPGWRTAGSDPNGWDAPVSVDTWLASWSASRCSLAARPWRSCAIVSDLTCFGNLMGGKPAGRYISGSC